MEAAKVIQSAGVIGNHPKGVGTVRAVFAKTFLKRD